MEKVFEHFNLDKSSESIYKYSPVFMSKVGDQDVVIKKTKKDNNQAERLFAWTEKLESEGIGVVRPIPFKNETYKTIEEANWVAYPFIHGRKYDASLKDIYDAGVMLGKIHGLKSQESMFDHGFDWEKYDNEFIGDVTEDLESLIDSYKDDKNIESFKGLSVEIMEILDLEFEPVKADSLPYVDSTWDYKANNLMYTDESLVLIDPDNAASIPRIFDLGLALILFHMEMETAPARMFTVEEWEKFKEGYLSHVTITEAEKEIWNKYLIFIFMDEGLWAMSDLEDSETERQKGFIRSLLGFDPNMYKL